MVILNGRIKIIIKMAYEMIINSHFHVLSYYLKKFTEYPFIQNLEFYQFSSQIFSYFG